MDYPKKLICDKNVTNELNLSNHWVYSSLQEEVSRGALLRQQKPRQNIDSFWNNRVKSSNQTSTSTTSGFQAILSGEPYCKSRKSKRIKSQKRCPLRVAELAAPTKRQCIESWRYNSRVLPTYMVDRLRQRVMDEKPIVQITDAITCFKRRKAVPKHRSSKSSYLTTNGNRMREIKMLSAIFGFKITVKLLRPLNLTLNPRLNEINKIVKEEIDLLLRKKRKSHQRKFCKVNENIVDEMARKITIWMDNILLDTNFKLLEESLRELEEEEGPILDFIDQLMDRVADICEPYYNESSEKSIKKPESVSTLSLFKNSLEFPKDSVKLLIEEICGKALENAERQNYNDSTSFVKVTDVENEIELTAQDMDTKNLDEDYKKVMETILWEIVENVVTSEFQLKENLSENPDIKVDIPSESNEHITTNNVVGLDLKSDLVHENDRILKKDILEMITSADENEQSTSSTFKENNKNNLITSEIYESNKVEENNDLEQDHEPNTQPFQFKNSKTEDEFVEDIQNKDKIETKIDSEEENGFTEENKDNQDESYQFKNSKTEDEFVEDIQNKDKIETKIDSEEENRFTEENKDNQDESYQFKNSKTEDEFVEDIQNKDKIETKIDENGFTKENKDNQDEIGGDVTFIEVEDREEKLMPENILVKDKNHDLVDSFVDSEAQKSGDIESEDKKVKFSDIDMGLGMNTETPLPTTLSAQEIFRQLSSRDNYKTNINLAPPNNNLLSDADESWPQHLPLPMIKVTESVNKSVTSLGKIFEADEKGLSTESSYDSIQVSEIIIDNVTSMPIDTNKIKDTLIEPFQNEQKIVGDNNRFGLNEQEKQSKRKNGKKELKNKKLNKSEHILKNTQNIINSKSQGFVPKDKTKIAPKKNDKEIKDKVSKEDNQRSKTISISNMNQTKIKKQSNVPKDIKKKAENVKTKGTKMKVETVKVDKTSNSDLKKHDKVLNDASGNKKRKNIPYHRIKSSSQQENKFKKLDEINIDTDDMFKWCKGLQNVINNLETWNAWINSTCECIKYLKHKGNAQSSRSIEKCRKKWELLHKSIQQDRHLWKDTKRRNREGLLRYKKYYYESGTEKNKCENCDCSNI